jgi:hypothetical protein
MEWTVLYRQLIALKIVLKLLAKTELFKILPTLMLSTDRVGAARIIYNIPRISKELQSNPIYPMLTVTANGTVASVAYKNGYIIQQVS